MFEWSYGLLYLEAKIGGISQIFFKDIYWNTLWNRNLLFAESDRTESDRQFKKRHNSI